MTQYDLPPAVIGEYDGRLWYLLPDDDTFIHLGIAPRPTTVWQCFVYHVCNGLIMRYPLAKVLVFSWRNRKSFTESETLEIRDALEGDGHIEIGWG